MRDHAAPTSANRDFVRVGGSPIDGTGLFARRPIVRGTRIIEYLGARVPIDYPTEEAEGGRTYGLVLDRTTVIDGARHGNEARFVNHSCEPNCETYVFDGRAWLYAMRDIARGEELTFDYQLGPADAEARRALDPTDYPCRCGAPMCRRTLLAPSTFEEIP